VKAPATRPFDLQGHRGARGLRPENTLAGFAHAIGLGVSALELDCGVTRDGVVVVAHDPRLNPDHTRDAQGRFLAATGPPLWSLSYAELQQYDVGRLRPGCADALEFPAQVAVDGERIPRLADVLSLARERGRGQVRVNIEVKTFPEQPELTMAPEPFARALQQVVEETGTADVAMIQSFDWRVVQAVHRLMPGLPTAALTDQQPGEDTVRIGQRPPSPWLGGLDPAHCGDSVPRLVQALRVQVWSPEYRDLDAARVRQAQALGLRVVPWTVNASADMRRMLDLGVDGMITDRPDQLRGLLARRGLEVPPVPEQPVTEWRNET
jgi:glycerophosphoryl diester phosphodiesterase